MKMIRNSECIPIKTAVKQDDLMAAWRQETVARDGAAAATSAGHQQTGTRRMPYAGSFPCRETGGFAGEIVWRVRMWMASTASSASTSRQHRQRIAEATGATITASQTALLHNAPDGAAGRASAGDRTCGQPLSGHGQNKAPATAGAGKGSVEAHAGATTERRELTCATGPARPAGPSAPRRHRWPQTCRKPAWPCHACA